MSSVGAMMNLTGALSGGGGGVHTRYFALWGAGGGGGSMDRSNGSFGGAGGNGAFLEIKIEGIPAGMQFRMASGGGGSAHLGNTVNGGKGGGGGAASLLLCEYEGATALVAVAGGGGGGAGGGSDNRNNRTATAGAGASSTSTTQGDARDHLTTLGGHTASPNNARGLVTRVNPPSKQTYAQNGGSGAEGDTSPNNNTSVGNGQVGGTLPTASWGGRGGTSGREDNDEGGGGGGGGGWFGGTGGYGGASNNYGGAGGGGGSSYVNSGTLTIGSASLTITRLQENVGNYRNVSSGSTAQIVVNNPSVTLAYGFTGGSGTGRGGRGGVRPSLIADFGNHGEVRMYTDTTLVQTVTGTSGSHIGQQAVVTIS